MKIGIVHILLFVVLTGLAFAAVANPNAGIANAVFLLTGTFALACAALSFAGTFRFKNFCRAYFVVFVLLFLTDVSLFSQPQPIRVKRDAVDLLFDKMHPEFAEFNISPSSERESIRNRPLRGISAAANSGPNDLVPTGGDFTLTSGTDDLLPVGMEPATAHHFYWIGVSLVHFFVAFGSGILCQLVSNASRQSSRSETSA